MAVLVCIGNYANNRHCLTALGSHIGFASVSTANSSAGVAVAVVVADVGLAFGKCGEDAAAHEHGGCEGRAENSFDFHV